MVYSQLELRRRCVRPAASGNSGHAVLLWSPLELHHSTGPPYASPLDRVSSRDERARARAGAISPLSWRPPCAT
jgi:hypothetical protein